MQPMVQELNKNDPVSPKIIKSAEEHEGMSEQEVMAASSQVDLI